MKGINTRISPQLTFFIRVFLLIVIIPLAIISTLNGLWQWSFLLVFLIINLVYTNILYVTKDGILVKRLGKSFFVTKDDFCGIVPVFRHLNCYYLISKAGNKYFFFLPSSKYVLTSDPRGHSNELVEQIKQIWNNF